MPTPQPSKYVELREVMNLEQVLEFPALHYEQLRAIADPTRGIGVHVADELRLLVALVPPAVLRVRPIAVLWQRLAAKIDSTAPFYRGHPEFDGWAEEASRTIRGALETSPCAIADADIEDALTRLNAEMRELRTLIDRWRTREPVGG